MPASSGRSSAQPAPPEGGSHEHAFQAVSPRRPQGRRRARRQLLARPADAATRSRKARRRPSRWRSPRSIRFLAIDAKGVVHGLFRQGRSRHRRAHRARADGGRGARRAVRRASTSCRATPRSRPTRARPGAASPSRSAACRSGRRRAAAHERAARRGRQAPRRREGGPHASPTASSAAGGKRVTYGELIGGKSFSHQARPEASRCRPRTPRTTRSSASRCRASTSPARSTGTFTYMQDFRVPGMLHGARGASAGDGRQARKRRRRLDQGHPGIAKVVRQGNFLAVVAENEWAAIKGARQLKATWSKWEGLPEQAKLYEHVRATKVAKDEVTSKVGNSAEALAQGAKKLNATYDFAIHTHGSIGPSCAVAEFKDGKLTSWSASQATHNLRKQLAQMFAMPLENVRCIYLEGSGCYGRNGHEDAAADAALLAKATGKPVRVQWSRADEHGWDPKGPPTLIDLRAALDASGNVTAWESEFFIPQIGGRLQRAAGGGDAGRHAARQATSRPGNIIQQLGHPLQVPQHQDGVPPARDDAVPPVLDPHAGADAEHLRQRVLHGRAGGGGRRRPDRVPPQVYRSRRQARHRGARTALAALAKWDKRPSPQGRPERRRRDGPRRVATSSTSWCAPTSAWSPRSRSTARPARSACTRFYVVARLRADHQSGRAQEPARRQRHPDGEPHAASRS